jgi:hypothetical protein
VAGKLPYRGRGKWRKTMTGGVDDLSREATTGRGRARGEWSWEAESRAGLFTRGFKADTSTYSSNTSIHASAKFD